MAKNRSRSLPTRGVLAVLCLLGATGAVLASARPAGATPTASLAPPLHSYGYRMVAGDGGVFDFNGARFYGSMGGAHLNRPEVGLADAPGDLGYWEVAGDGGIFAFGDAPFHGSMGGLRLNAPVVGMVASADGNGYLLFAGDGGIFAFGDAGFHGSLGDLRLTSPVVGVAGTPDGGGYWILQRDGTVSVFGDATIPTFVSPTNNFGSAAMSIASTPDGGGYWVYTTDGEAHASGDASTWTSAGGSVGVWSIGGVSTPDGLGYWTANVVGAVQAYGDASDAGSMAGQHLNGPIVAISTVAAPVPIDGSYQGASAQDVKIYPSPTPGAPVVVLVHGGGYVGGSNVDPLVPGEAVYLQASGVTVYDINYDLSFPTEVDDTVAAIGFAEATAGRYDGNPGVNGSNLTLVGGSAGGTLVALAAERVPVKGVVDLSGPSDFPSYFAWLEGGGSNWLVPIMESAFGCTPLAGCSPAQLAAWSPAEHPALAGEHWLVGQALGDPLVPLAQGQAMAGHVGAAFDPVAGSFHAFALCPWLDADILAVVRG